MNEIINIRQKLNQYKKDYDIIQTIPCSAKANKECQQILKDSGSLPKNFYPCIYDNHKVSTNEFYKVVESDLSDAEIQEYLMYKELGYIKTIKNCAVFFTVLTVLSVISCLILAFSMLT